MEVENDGVSYQLKKTRQEKMGGSDAVSITFFPFTRARVRLLVEKTLQNYFP